MPQHTKSERRKASSAAAQFKQASRVLADPSKVFGVKDAIRKAKKKLKKLLGLSVSN